MKKTKTIDIPKAVMDKALGYFMSSDMSNSLYKEFKKKCDGAGLNIENVIYSLIRKYDVSDEVFEMKAAIFNLDSEVEALKAKKVIMITELQAKCEHKNIVQYYDKDKGIVYYMRGCIDCYLVETAKKCGEKYDFEKLKAEKDRSISQINKEMFNSVIVDLKKNI
jgi:hypothetical protein